MDLRSQGPIEGVADIRWMSEMQGDRWERIEEKAKEDSVAVEIEDRKDEMMQDG